ncbi:hypothetical protein [Priestia aryabhattai]|nr:hypothetical protein [Priestia aryabhattai]
MEEESTITIKRKKRIDILIVGMPEQGADAFYSSIALDTYHKDSLILYIGTEGTAGGNVADDDFFDHLEPVEDDDFDKYVFSNYPNQITEFQERYILNIANDFLPILYKFKRCSGMNCCCNTKNCI